MQALRHLDKQFIVLPVFMLAINSACYSIIPAANINAQHENSVKIYQQQVPKKLPQYRALCDEKFNHELRTLISTVHQIHTSR